MSVPKAAIWRDRSLRECKKSTINTSVAHSRSTTEGSPPLRRAGPLRHRAGLHNFGTPPHPAISTRLSSPRRVRRNDRFTLASGLCQRHVEWHQNLYHQPTRHFPPVRAPASSGFEVQPNRPLRVQAVARLPEGLRSHFDIVKMKSGLEPANLGILSVQHCA